MKRIILVDGNSLMYRAYYGMAATGSITQNSKGLYTNAIYAFARMMNNLIQNEYDNILVAFDAGKKTFRHEFMDEYKGGRSPMPDEMRMQIAYIKQYLEIMRIKQYEIKMYEADDIIGTMAKMAEQQGLCVDIYSSDKDLLQLVTDKTTVHLTKKGMTDLENYTPESFFDKYQIRVDQFVDLKAMMGDKSDNLAGVPGIGEKKAVKYLQTYGTLENILDNAENIKGADKDKFLNNKDQALLCQKMATIKTDSPIEITVDDTVKQDKDIDALTKFYQELEFKSLLKELAMTSKNTLVTENYEVIKDPVRMNEVLEPYSSFIFETCDYNYHRAPLLVIGMKNKHGNFVFDPEMLYYSLDLQMYLVDPSNHKSIFDYKRCYVLLRRLGFELKGIDFDLLLATYIINPQIAKEEFKTIADYYQYSNVYYDEEIYGKGTKKQIPEMNKIYEHVVKKCIALSELKQQCMEKLEARHQTELLTEMEIPLSRVLGKMEFTGMKVDMEELKRQEATVIDKINVLEKEIYDLVGEEFNISSPKQLGVILFEKLGIPYPKKTKGSYSTDAEVLESIKAFHPVVKKVMEYRQWTKLNSTYLTGMEPQIYEDGKVHTIFQQALTQTGRLSSVEPNLQNIPIRTPEGHLIRKMFVPENKANTMFSADYSQIELRVLAHMADVKKLQEAFNNGEDIHSKTAQEIFGHSDITDLERRRAKAVNFGIVYGISAFGLAQDIGVSNYEASEFIKKYYEIYPEIKDFMNETIESCKELGYVKTLKNRIRFIPDINSKIYLQREFAKRTAMNAPIQGSAADILKIAMIKVDNEMEEKKLKSKLLVTVHDELVFEIEKGEEDVMQELVLRNMANAMKLDVPLVADSSFGANWYEVK